MRAHDLMTLALVLALGAVSCGDDKPSTTGQIFPDPPEGGTSSACEQMCAQIVSTGTDCQTYDANSRCYQICNFYSSNACAAEYRLYMICLTESGDIMCMQSGGAKPALVVPAVCNDEYETWNTCTVDKDAGVCPY